MKSGITIPPRPFPSWLFPFVLALGGYLILASFSFRPGRLPLSIWWSVQAAGWLSCAWFLHIVRKGGWPSIGWLVMTALAFRLCGLWATPTLEDDYQRYLWDGWRTVQDGSPYDRAPQEFFRSPAKRPPGIETALNEINNPDLTTIYAPVTQLLFAAAAAVAPGSLFTLKLFLLLVDLALLLLLAGFGGRNAVWFYGWCPLVVAENAFHAHPEAWPLFWLIAAWICVRRHRYLTAGALAGVAVGAKLFALLALPFLAWQRPKVVIASFLAALGIIYGPIFAMGSSAEWPGLRAMAGYFEFNSLGFSFLATCFGSKAARFLCLALFGLIATLLFARWIRREGKLEAAPMANLFLAFFLLSPVLNPWYVVWLVPFAAMAPARAAIALLLVVPLSYATGLNLGDPTLATYGQPIWVRPIEFGAVLLATLSRIWPLGRATGFPSLFR